MVGWSVARLPVLRMVVEGWRARRERLVSRSKPTYDAYPERDVPPEMRFYVEARDVRGRLLREYVDLAGYSLHQLNWRRDARRGDTTVRDWFTGQVVEAMIRLAARLDEVKHMTNRGQGLVEYALILALIAIVAILALVFLGGQIVQVFNNIANQIPGQ